jgi:hypothetical protein
MAEIKNINISQFAEQFQNEYDILYESDCTDDGVRFAAWAFDDFAKKHKDFISEFVKFRGDFISSDREAAAFMYALEKVA